MSGITRGDREGELNTRDIEDRLVASVRHDAINGNEHERSVCARQMTEAALEIAHLRDANEQLEQIRAQLLDELDTTWVRLRACAIRLQEMEPLARELCDKLDAIITHPSYLGVFQVARIHGIHYTGAECQNELRALKEMLNTGDGTVNGIVPEGDGWV